MASLTHLGQIFLVSVCGSVTLTEIEQNLISRRNLLRPLFLIAALFGMTVTPAPAAADPDWELMAEFPLPSWQTHPSDFGESRYDTNVTRTDDFVQTIHELMPKGQTDATWRKRWWLVDIDGVTRAPEPVMMARLRREAENCATDAKYDVLGKSARHVMFWVVCGRTRDRGMGYTGMVWIGRSKDGLILVSEEWLKPPTATALDQMKQLDKDLFATTVRRLNSTSLP